MPPGAGLRDGMAAGKEEVRVVFCVWCDVIIRLNSQARKTLIFANVNRTLTWPPDLDNTTRKGKIIFVGRSQKTPCI